MSSFYIRWGVLLLVTSMIAFLGFQRYQRDVASLTPDQLLENPTPDKTRVMGIIQGGTLTREHDSNRAYFLLQGENKTLPVRYEGHDTDTLRDLKVIVVTGHINSVTAEFDGESVSLIPNYGFVTVAYLLGILPTLFFLFLMERKLRLLYTEVKEAKLYEPEAIDFDKE
ncbi:MAG: cytochrome c maturation protein CcmE [Nitrospirae bacterium]|nr:cytochrome c maturation protein CcmE [Nitrospirota bacterium]